MNPTQVRGNDAVLNVDELFERCLGHLDFLERILNKFQQHFEEGLDQLDESVKKQDAEGVVQVAHRLKGAAANVAAAGLRERAAEIEKLGRSGWLPEIPEKVSNIRDDWSRFVEEVATLDLCGASR